MDATTQDLDCSTYELEPSNFLPTVEPERFEDPLDDPDSRSFDPLYSPTDEPERFTTRPIRNNEGHNRESDSFTRSRSSSPNSQMTLDSASDDDNSDSDDEYERLWRADLMISKLPTVTASALAHNPDCMICREALGFGSNGEAEAPVRLQCGHVVGEVCIKKWFAQTRGSDKTCPMCRSVLFREDSPISDTEIMVRVPGLRDRVGVRRRGRETSDNEDTASTSSSEPPNRRSIAFYNTVRDDIRMPIRNEPGTVFSDPPLSALRTTQQVQVPNNTPQTQHNFHPEVLAINARETLIQREKSLYTRLRDQYHRLPPLHITEEHSQPGVLHPLGGRLIMVGNSVREYEFQCETSTEQAFFDELQKIGAFIEPLGQRVRRITADRAIVNRWRWIAYRKDGMVYHPGIGLVGDEVSGAGWHRF